MDRGGTEEREREDQRVKGGERGEGREREERGGGEGEVQK